MRAQDLIVVVTSVGTEDQALDIAHALVELRELLPTPLLVGCRTGRFE